MDEKRKEIGFEIRTLSLLIKRRHRQSAASKEMDEATGTNGWVIGYLAHHEDVDVFQRDLEKEFSIRRSTATNILQLMERKGLITREAVECDARLKKLVLTEKGRILDRGMRQCIEETELLLKKGLSDDEISEFYRLVGQMERNLEAEETE